LFGSVVIQQTYMEHFGTIQEIGENGKTSADLLAPQLCQLARRDLHEVLWRLEALNLSLAPSALPR
jgi:hypothetical protein